MSKPAVSLSLLSLKIFFHADTLLQDAGFIDMQICMIYLS